MRFMVNVIEEEPRVQPIIQFAQATLGHIDERFIKAIEAMSAEALNGQPCDETTNSLAQIVRHVASGRTFMLGIALGRPLPTFTGPPDARAGSPPISGEAREHIGHAELTVQRYQRYGARATASAPA